MTLEELSFEDAFERLQAAIQRLEEGGIEPVDTVILADVDGGQTQRAGEVAADSVALTGPAAPISMWVTTAAPHTLVALVATDYGIAILPSNVRVPQDGIRAIPLVTPRNSVASVIGRCRR